MAMRLKAAVVVSLAIPAALGVAQRAGVSHPDEVAVTTSTEASGPVAVYRPTPAEAVATPIMRARPAAMAEGAEPVLRATSTGRGMADSDADANVVMRIDGPANWLPAGTLVKARMGQALSTEGTTEGSVFSARLVEAVERDGHVLLPAGSLMLGRVTDVHGGRRISGPASIHLEPTTIQVPDGTKYAVHAQVIDTDVHRFTKVDREGTIQRRDHPKATLTAMTLTTGSGAAAGAVFGGVPGALIGAGVGAGVSTVVWLKQDRQEALPVNTGVVFALTSGMTVE